jgi:hypothetical protein
MENPILPKTRASLARVIPGPFGPIEREFKPIGAAARLVVENLARQLDSNRASSDLQSGGSE